MHRFRYDGTRPARSYTPGLPSSRIVSIGRSGGEGAVGLERPTVVELAIAAVPLPYLVTSTIVALLATGPGYFLARLIENGGGLEQNPAGIFRAARALPLRPAIPPIILPIGVYPLPLLVPAAFRNFYLPACSRSRP